MHPRASVSPTAGNKRAKAILEFVRERGSAHPREVDAHFAHGRVTNYWGGSSSATTHMLELMHYKGLLRVARREAGIRVYAAQQHGPGPAGAAARRAHLDRARRYAWSASTRRSPPRACRSSSARLRYATPHWHGEIKSAHSTREDSDSRTRSIDGHTWYWPADESMADHEIDGVRLLAPFDPVVWDRRRFELLWGWAYRFEAYTPAPKRKHGYYALPLLWRNRVIGWANVAHEGRRGRCAVRLRQRARAARSWIQIGARCRDRSDARVPVR